MGQVKKSKMVQVKKNKKVIGLTLIAIFIMLKLIEHYFMQEWQSPIFLFSSSIISIVGILLLIPFDLIPNYFWDNKEYEKNETLDAFINKLRFRGVLFNNLSITVLVTTILVIVFGFYLLVDPPLKSLNDNNQLATGLTIRISSSVLLIFLVQILFRVFKYLLRVAAFYNGKADAIEFNILKPETELEKLMDSFIPDKYDITDLQQSSISDNLSDIIKAKIVK